MRELAVEPRSHYWSALSGLLWPTSIGEAAVIAHAEMFANANRDPKSDPVKFPSPFPQPEAEKPATAEEIERARAVLNRYSMFAD